jgi:curved DNA-binding protein CbpA
MREPARYRGRLLHGDSALFGGTMILRYAQANWPRVLTQGRAEQEVLALRNAARFYIRQVCFWSEATHYQILCVPQDAPVRLVKTHFRLLMAIMHPDRLDAAGEKWPAEFASRLNQAYEVLTSEESRSAYDRTLKRREKFIPVESTAASPGKGKVSPWFRRPWSLRPLLVAAALVLSLLVAQLWWTEALPESFAILENPLSTSRLTSWLRIGKEQGAQPRISAAPDLVSIHETKGADATLSMPRKVASATDATRPHSGESGDLEPASTRRLSPMNSVSSSSIEPPSFSVGTVRRDRVVDPALTAQVEAMAFQLVSSYATGDLSALLGLIDFTAPGAPSRADVERRYVEFFSSTRERRLRLNRLIWQSDAESVVATGEATVAQVNAIDGALQEQKSDFMLRMVRQDGRLAIRTMSLYPQLMP